MIRDFFANLRGQPPEQPLPELTAELAVVVLLVRLAKADQHYAVEEIRLIDRLIAAQMDLNPVEAAKLRANGERLEASAPDSDTLRMMVQQDISPDDRVALLEALWQVGLADRIPHPAEDQFLSAIADSLGVAGDTAQTIKDRYTTKS